MTSQYILDAHFIVAALVIICAVVFSWNTMGRRVMVAVTGLQVLVGLVVAGVFHPASSLIWLHLTGALAAMVAYIFARRIGEQPGKGALALALSLLGLVLAVGTFALGMTLARGSMS